MSQFLRVQSENIPVVLPKDNTHNIDISDTKPPSMKTNIFHSENLRFLHNNQITYIFARSDTQNL